MSCPLSAIMDSMNSFKRYISDRLEHVLSQGKSILLLGPRQVGKTTALKALTSDLYLNLMDPEVVMLYDRTPQQLRHEIQGLATSKKPLVIIDEIQKCPHLTDLIQVLIDDQIAQFILCGSSVRKIKNLLPGRLVCLYMAPVMLTELPSITPKISQLLLNGMLPEIIQKEGSPTDIDLRLKSYVITYLEEEIRKEALVRQIVPFSKFLRLSAIESGRLINFRKLATQIGISHTTIAEYYRILESCMVVERFDAYSESQTRRRLATTSKYIFFDLGVRRLAAEEGHQLPEEYMGHLFEQWVGLELRKELSLRSPLAKVTFWRDHNGPEIDWLIQDQDQLTPIEVKWTSTPSLRDAKHLELFLQEYSNAKEGFIICNTPKTLKLSSKITALPWQKLQSLFG